MSVPLLTFQYVIVFSYINSDKFTVLFRVFTEHCLYSQLCFFVFPIRFCFVSYPKIWLKDSLWLHRCHNPETCLKPFSFFSFFHFFLSFDPRRASIDFEPGNVSFSAWMTILNMSCVIGSSDAMTCCNQKPFAVSQILDLPMLKKQAMLKLNILRSIDGDSSHSILYTSAK